MTQSHYTLSCAFIYKEYKTNQRMVRIFFKLLFLLWLRPLEVKVDKFVLQVYISVIL